MPAPRHTLAAAGLALLFSVAVARADWPPSPYVGGVALGLGGVPAIASDGAGGTFVAGTSLSSGALVQHLGPHGDPLWTAGGIAAGTAGSAIAGAGCAVIPDGAGGVVVAYLSTSNRLTVQRIDASGTRLWGASGLTIGGSSIDPFTPSVCGDGAGGGYFSWSQDKLLHGQIVPNGAFVAHVVGAGTLAFSVNTTYPAAIATDGAGGVIYTWSAPNGGQGYDIYAQRLNGSGTALWNPSGVDVVPLTLDQMNPVIAADNAGGAIIVWNDYRSYIAPNYPNDYYAQHVDATGLPLWSLLGVPVCVSTWARADLVIAPDGTGGAVMAWDDARDFTHFHIYTQRLGYDGTVMWASNGLPVCLAVGDQGVPGIASNGAGGALLAWRDQRGGVGYDVYGAVVTAAGTQLGLANGIPLGVAAGDQSDVVVAPDGDGAAVVAWSDTRPGSGGARAQRIDPLGFPGDPSPVITSVRDIPQDQGGRVLLSWRASYADSATPYPPGYEFAIQDYQVERRISPTTWQLVATTPSGPFTHYSVTLPTGADSTGASAADVSYRVKARWSTTPDAMFWYSAPDSGHSVDNLAPFPPAGLSVAPAGDGSHLSWSPGLEPDLAAYRIHRVPSPDVPPTAANLLATVTSTSYVDREAPACVYEVTAVDRHGNESAPATFTVTSGPPLVMSGPFSFAPPNPNPARDAAALQFTLPEAGPVRLEVFDLGGRRVRDLSPGLLAAGPHRVDYDLRDASGRPLPPGVFELRLSVAGERRTRRLAVVR